MTIKEIRVKTDKDLAKLLAEKREHLRELHFKVSLKQQKNYKELSTVKHDIAKIVTVINERRHLKELKAASTKK